MAQSLDFAAREIGPPMGELLDRLVRARVVGTPLSQSLADFAESVGNDDARLLVLILGIHSRTGGSLARALAEVTNTIRHRLAVRRELKALTAQGRISGAVLGSLPIAFFLVLAATSRRELTAVYRSGLGIAMLSAGFALQGLAYLWIRRLLQVRI